MDVIRRKGETLVQTISQALRARITGGSIGMGERLPSESRLCEEFGVSRTVIREAIAVLRADGLVEARQGSGVFVISAVPGTTLPFSDIDYESISSVIEILELRVAVEVEAAALAARRHSPAQIERIHECARRVNDLAAAGQPSWDADFEFHLAIAEATNNPRFVEFLTLLGARAIPRAIRRSKSARIFPAGNLSMIEGEHQRIAEAILDGNEQAAGAAMRRHLEGAQKRHRAMLRPPADVA